MDKAQMRKAFESVVKTDDIESFEDPILLRLTGLTLKQIMELKKRDTAVIMVDIRANKKDNGRLLFGTCPKCKKRVTNVEGGNFCQNCGQRLKWEDKRENV